MKVNSIVQSVLFVAGIAALGSARCESRAPTPKQVETGGTGHVVKELRPLGIYVSSDRNVYRISDKIRFRVLLKNESSEEFWVYNHLGWGVSSSFSIWAKDAKSGKEATGKYMQDALTPPPSSKDQFTRLQPGYIFGFEDELKIEQLNIVTPGEYSVEIEYHSPIYNKFRLGLPIWSREMGNVGAAPLRLRVVP